MVTLVQKPRLALLTLTALPAWLRLIVAGRPDAAYALFKQRQLSDRVVALLLNLAEDCEIMRPKHRARKCSRSYPQPAIRSLDSQASEIDD